MITMSDPEKLVTLPLSLGPPTMHWAVDLLTDALGSHVFGTPGGLWSLVSYWVRTAVDRPLDPGAAATWATLVQHVVRDTEACELAIFAVPYRPPDERYATVLRFFKVDAGLAVLAETLAQDLPVLAELLAALHTPGMIEHAFVQVRVTTPPPESSPQVSVDDKSRRPQERAD